MEGSRVVDNLVDRLSEGEAAKEEEKRQTEAAWAARGDRGVQGWWWDGPEAWCGDW